MTSPAEPGLMDLATPYALHAISAAEAVAVERELAAAPEPLARAFAEEVRVVRETVAALSAGTAQNPPEHLRARVLQGAGRTRVVPLRRRSRRRIAVLAAAATLVLGLGAAGVAVGLGVWQSTAPSAVEQVLAAPDLRSSTAAVDSGGVATVRYSARRNEAVLVLRGVAEPPSDHVLQLWLIAGGLPHPAGIAGSGTAAEMTALVDDVDGSQALAVTVEPGPGARAPSTPPIVQLSLV